MTRTGTAQVTLVVGTSLWTADGILPVEVLDPGERIISRDAGMVRVTAVARDSLRLRCVALAPGALGRGRPEREMVLPADTLVRSAAGMLRPVLALVDGSALRDLGVIEVGTVALGCAAPHLLYAEGLEIGMVPPLSAVA